MKHVSGLHVVPSGLTEQEEEALPPKNGTPGNGAGRQLLDRSKLTRLLKERRYEDALEMLLKARQHAPDDPTVSRSIRLLKDKLTLKYAEAVGSLDHVPRCTVPDAELASLSLSFEERGVLALVDGIATFGDIVDTSTHGKFATYRALASFLEKGIVIRAGGESATIPTGVVAQRGRPVLAKVPAAAAPAPAPERRAPTRFAEPPPQAPAPSIPMPWENLPPVPEDGTALRATWEDIEDDEDFQKRDPREETQPMFQLAALAAAGALGSTLAPPPAEPAPNLAEANKAGAQAKAPPPAPPLATELPAPEPVSTKPGLDYDALFERATRAYVRRSYDEAMTLFEEYLQKRPDDRRALHNLEQLRKRRKGS